MLAVTASQSSDPSDDTVMKSAVMNTEVVPGMASTSRIPSGASSVDVKVAGPPTGLPTVNFMARGLGVGSTETLITDPRSRASNGSGG